MTKSFFLFATLTVCVLLSSMLTGENNQIIKNGSRLYLSGELIVKLKNEQSIDHLKSQITRQFKLSGKSGMIVAKQIFGNQKKSADLNRIFSLSYNSAIDPLIISHKFAANNLVEWIEPRYVYEVSTVPNDPSYSSQWGLVKVKAAEAWDVTQGDTSVIIGIVDTGIDWDHPDLNANIWVNKTEIAGNGIDDDNNGYIDDNIGWDFGGLTGLADNNPMEDRPDHGTHVAGIASAVTNNGTGVAGMGYKCKLMAVKTSQDNYRNNSGSPYIVFGFEGIVYAVDNGCKVVNCSWGGYSYSHYGQSVADYAALHNVLIVAAAGNDNSSETHYPSGYTGILSVASSGSSDMKSSFSNYGISVDVTAPGESIFNTWMNNTYANLSGTSMAAPLTAGLAGLVAAKFPAYSAKQIGERIRVTCTNIESINPSYAKLLGRGRINAYDAVSLTNLTSIRAEEINTYESAGDGDGILEPGETFGLKLKCRNYLDPVTSVIVGLESFSAYASVINPGFTYNGSLATGDVFNNNNNPLTVTIAPNTPPNTSLRFSVNFLVNGVLDWQGVTVVVNPSFATQSNGKIQVTFTSKGTFGFNDYSANLQGDGFIYDTGSNLIFEGALITGNSAARISDVARNAGTGSTQNTDFLPKRPFAISYPGVFADAEGLTVFSDAGAGSSALGVTCSLKTYSFTSTAKENFVLMRYQFLNTGTSEIGNFYAGLFTDWDIAGGVNDYTNYDTIGRFGFQYQIGSSPAYVGVVALGATTGYYGVLNPGGDGGINIYDGFTDAEKWTTISGGLAKTSAGGGDVSFVSSVGPITLLPGVNTPVGFALIAGYNLDALRIAAQSARDSYAAILLDIDDKVVSRDVENFQVYGNYPNPFNPSTKISYFIPQADNISIQVFNRMGELVKTVFSGRQTSGYHSVDWNAIEMASGVYFCRVTAGQKSITKKLILLK